MKLQYSNWQTTFRQWGNLTNRSLDCSVLTKTSWIKSSKSLLIISNSIWQETKHTTFSWVIPVWIMTSRTSCTVCWSRRGLMCGMMKRKWYQTHTFWRTCLKGDRGTGTCHGMLIRQQNVNSMKIFLSYEHDSNAPLIEHKGEQRRHKGYEGIQEASFYYN